jgi:hypothetical protein
MKKQLQQFYMPIMVMLTMCMLGSASYAQLFELRLTEVGINGKEKDLSIMKVQSSENEFFVGSTGINANNEIMRLKRIFDNGTIAWSKEYPGIYRTSRFFSFTEIDNEGENVLLVSGYSLDTTNGDSINRLTIWWIKESDGSIIKSHIFNNFIHDNVYGLNIEVSPHNLDIYVAGLISTDNDVRVSSIKKSFVMKINYNADIIWSKYFESGAPPASDICSSDYDAFNHIIFGNTDEVYLLGNSNYAEVIGGTLKCNRLKAQLLKLSVYDGSIIFENKHAYGSSSFWNAGVRGIKNNDGIVTLENNRQDRNFSLLNFDNAGNIVNVHNYDILGGNSKLNNVYGYNIKEDDRYYYVSGLIVDTAINFIDSGAMFLYKINKGTFLSSDVTVFPLVAGWYVTTSSNDYFKDYIKEFPIAYYPENSDLYYTKVYGISANEGNSVDEEFVYKGNTNLVEICTNKNPKDSTYEVIYNVYDSIISSDQYPELYGHLEKAELISYEDRICFNYNERRNKILNSEEFEGAGEINIYPNPTSNDLFISGFDIIKIEVYDSRGQLLISSHKQLSDDIQLINLSDVNAGIYLIKVYQKESLTQRKVIVLR